MEIDFEADMEKSLVSADSPCKPSGDEDNQSGPQVALVASLVPHQGKISLDQTGDNIWVCAHPITYE